MSFALAPIPRNATSGALRPPEESPLDVERNARAQALYREVNQNVRELEEKFGTLPSIEVLCECGRGCSDRLELPVADYDRARREPTYFLVAPEHLAPEVDRVVENHDSWLLVEAIGTAAEIARDDAAR